MVVQIWEASLVSPNQHAAEQQIELSKFLERRRRVADHMRTEDFYHLFSYLFLGHSKMATSPLLYPLASDLSV
jgi:hypothetical protein